MNYIAIFLLLISLGGCATHPQQANRIPSIDEQKQALSAEPCCASLRELRALPVSEVGKSIDFQLIPPDRPLSGSHGRAYGRLLRLPDELKVYDFVIESYSTKVDGVRQLFAPVVYVLNEDFSLSRASRLQMLRMDVENALWGERQRTTIFVHVDRNAKPNERYVVITTDPEAYGKFLDLRSIPTPNRPLYYVSDVSAEPNTRFLPEPIQLSPEGALRITNLSSFMQKPFEHWIMF